MREVLLDPSWGRHHVLQNAVYVLAGMGVVVSVLLGHISLPWGAYLIVPVVGVGVALDVWRFTHYRCGRCQRTLPAPRHWWIATQGRGRTEFACRHCDIVWATRLSREA